MYSYHHAPDEFLSAAHMGRWLPTTPGKATTKFKTLSGVTANRLTPNNRQNLLARRGNTYQRVGGRNITWEGTVASLENKFFDITRNLHWLRDEILSRVFGIFVGQDIVPYTPEGIQTVVGGIEGALELAIQNGVASSTPKPQVTGPVFEEISTDDKGDRVLRNVLATFTLSGAVHSVLVDLTVSF